MYAEITVTYRQNNITYRAATFKPETLNFGSDQSSKVIIINSTTNINDSIRNKTKSYFYDIIVSLETQNVSTIKRYMLFLIYTLFYLRNSKENKNNRPNIHQQIKIYTLNTYFPSKKTTFQHYYKKFYIQLFYSTATFFYAFQKIFSLFSSLIHLDNLFDIQGEIKLHVQLKKPLLSLGIVISY